MLLWYGRHKVGAAITMVLLGAFYGILAIINSHLAVTIAIGYLLILVTNLVLMHFAKSKL